MRRAPGCVECNGQPVIDTLQTLPSFVYLIPVVMLFRVGEFTAMIAIVLYALAPSYYPPHIRAAGAGAAIAVGRLGSIGGPLIAGELRAAGYGPGDVLMALIPAVLLTTACVWALTTFCKPHPEA